MKKAIIFSFTGIACLLIVIGALTISLNGQVMASEPISDCDGVICPLAMGLDCGDFDPGGGKPLVCCGMTKVKGYKDITPE